MPIKPSSRIAGAFVNKGALDCSGNPNYPAAVNGDTYKVSVAGKVGGASGVTVEVGDEVICMADNAGGTQAGVGSSWIVIQANVVNPLLAANNLSDVASRGTAQTTLKGFTSTATAAGTTTLTSSSTSIQEFTGSANQNLKLPVVSTLALGWTFYVINNSTGVVTVQSSATNLILTVAPNTYALLTCIAITGTGAASWDSASLAALTPSQDGQLLIGSGGNAPVIATLSAGTGVSITNGAGSIQISANSNVSTVALGADSDPAVDTTLVDSALTLPVDANGTYNFRFVIFTSNAGTLEGVKLALGGTCTVLAMKAQIFIYNDTTNALVGFARVTALGSAIGSGLGATENYAIVEGSIEVDTGGTLLLQYAQNAAGASAGVLLQRNSNYILTKV